MKRTSLGAIALVAATLGVQTTASAQEVTAQQKQQAEILTRVITGAKTKVDSILAQTGSRHRGPTNENEAAAQGQLTAASSQLSAAATYCTNLAEITAGIRPIGEWGYYFTMTCSASAVAQVRVAQARLAALSPPLPPPPPPPTIAAFGPELAIVSAALIDLRGPPPSGASCP